MQAAYCRGNSLVSLAVSMACQSSVKAFYEYGAGGNGAAQSQSLWQQILEFGTTPQGEKLYSSCMGTFVKEGMEARFHP